MLWMSRYMICRTLAPAENEINNFFLNELKCKAAVIITKVYVFFSERLQWWGSDHSLLFIDSPVGAGYSFTQDNRGFIRDLNEVKVLYMPAHFVALFTH